MFNRVVSLLAVAVAFIGAGSAEVVSQNLGSININTPMYTASAVDEIIGSAGDGLTTNDVCAIVTNVVSDWNFPYIIADAYQAPSFDWIVSYGDESGSYYVVDYLTFTNGAWSLLIAFYMFEDRWYQDDMLYETVTGYGPDADSLVFPGQSFGGPFTVTRQERNALGLARLIDLPPLTNGLATAASLASLSSQLSQTSKDATNYTDTATNSLLTSLAPIISSASTALQPSATNNLLPKTGGTIYDGSIDGGQLEVGSSKGYFGRININGALTELNVYGTSDAMGGAYVTIGGTGVVSVLTVGGTNVMDRIGEIESGVVAVAQSATNYTDSAISRIPTGLTTNDVCAIVTNEVPAEFSKWTLCTNGVPFVTGIVFEFVEIMSEWELHDVNFGDGQICRFESNVVNGSIDALMLEMIGYVGGSDQDNDDMWHGNVVAVRTFTPSRNALGLARLIDLPPLTNDLSTFATTTDLYRATSQMWVDNTTIPATTNFNQNFVPLYRRDAYSDLDAHVGNGYYGDDNGTIRVYNTSRGILLKDPSSTTYPTAESYPYYMWGVNLAPFGFSFNMGLSNESVSFRSWGADESGDAVRQSDTNTYVSWLNLMTASQPLPYIESPTLVGGRISNEEDYIKRPVSSRAVYRGMRAMKINGHQLYNENDTIEDGEHQYSTTIVGTDIPQTTNANAVSVGERLSNILDERVEIPENSWRQTDGGYILSPIAFDKMGDDGVLWGDVDANRYILLYQNSTYHYLTNMPEYNPSTYSVTNFAGNIGTMEVDFGRYGRFHRSPSNETVTIHSIYSDQLEVALRNLSTNIDATLETMATNITEDTLSRVTRVYTEDGMEYLDATGALTRIVIPTGDTLIMTNYFLVSGSVMTYTNVADAPFPAFYLKSSENTRPIDAQETMMVVWSSAQSKWLQVRYNWNITALTNYYGTDLAGYSPTFSSRGATTPETSQFEFGSPDQNLWWVCYIPKAEPSTGVVNTVVFSKGDAKIEGCFSQGSNTVASGVASTAIGWNTTSGGRCGFASGYNTSASADASRASGIYTWAHAYGAGAYGAGANASNGFSYVWSPVEVSTVGAMYGSHGIGTFNVNPAGGLGGFYIGNDTLHAAFYNALTSSSPVQVTTKYENEDGTTNNVTTTLPSLRQAVEAVSVAAVTSPSGPFAGWSLPEYISAIQKYEWDAKAQVCYRREVTNDYIILKAVTNIDLTAVGNLSALKEYEDGIAVRRPPQITGGYTVGYESDSDKIISSGGNYVLEGNYLLGASVTMSYDISGNPTTETIADASLTTTDDTITIAYSALAGARSVGGTVTFTIQTAYGKTTATAVVTSSP